MLELDVSIYHVVFKTMMFSLGPNDIGLKVDSIGKDLTLC